ncbi:hypothetical protein D3C84_283380 [compost metagenome]|uniref:hypothetical protein n=1 Tax=Pseudomonas sp. PDM29 TaxID=2854771 RepID=UPI000F9EEE6D|nr:hypothetical protein [Pseudomonas sp. PDM29]MBV7524788.1 hypothetical protein [Pseudomonas sp. PDM29]
MRDALTGFVVKDVDDFTSIDTRRESVPRDPYNVLNRGAKVASKLSAPTSSASDIFSYQDLSNDAQSVTAFEEIDRRRADATDFELCLRSLRVQGAIRDSNRIADRLACLLELYREDYDGKSLSSSSLITFIEFLRIYQDSKFPTITATPSGELYVQWKYDQCQRLGVQFLAANEVKWVVFKKNLADEERIDQFSGHSEIDLFRESANTLGIHGWIVR